MPAVIVLAGCWIAGLAMVALWNAPAWLAGAVLLSLVPAAAAGWLGIAPRVVLMGAVVALVAAWRFGEWQDQAMPDLAAYVGTGAVVEGSISSLPARGVITTSYRFEVERIDTDGDWRDTDGAVRLTFSQFADYREGERLQLTGRLEEPATVEGFDYPAYLARQGIVGTMQRPKVVVLDGPDGISVRRVIGGVRLSLEEALQRALPEPQASLAAGIALGRDGEIPRELYDDFRTTGLAHIVAVSGSNVALLTGMVFLALTPLVGYYRATIPSFLVVVLYVGVAGAEASVVRAGVMAVVFLLGLALGRQQSGVAALGVAAVGMTAMDPGTAADVGFQLSLAATAGLIVFGPWLHYGLQRALGQAAGFASGLLEIVAWTIAATVGTLPIIWLNFGDISLIGVLANIAVEPVFALALGLSLVTAVAGAVWEPAGWATGLVTYYPLAFITWLTGELARVPFASVSPERIGGSTAAAMYAALVAAGIAALRCLPPDLDRRTGPNTAPAMRRFALAGMTGGMGVVVWWWGVAPLGGPGELEIAVLDVGQGDAILVTTPGGQQVLVDGGRSGLELVQELGEVLPHWDRRLDAVILSHPQEDHVAGLPEVLARFAVGAVYDDGAENKTEAFRAFERGAGAVRTLAAGDALALDGVVFTVLWPPADRTGGDLNDRSLVIRVAYGDTTMLLTGDIEGPAQRALMESGGLEADVLKVPHHGSATSLPAFFEAVDARVALISVGEGNAFRHPREETLEALGDAATYRTDTDGRITVRSNGRRLTVDTER